MISNNTLAILVLVSIVVSIVGMAVVYSDFMNPITQKEVKVGKGMVKLNVVPKGTLPPNGAMVKLNVIEKGGK